MAAGGRDAGAAWGGRVAGGRTTDADGVRAASAARGEIVERSTTGAGGREPQAASNNAPSKAAENRAHRRRAKEVKFITGVLLRIGFSGQAIAKRHKSYRIKYLKGPARGSLSGNPMEGLAGSSGHWGKQSAS